MLGGYLFGKRILKLRLNFICHVFHLLHGHWTFIARFNDPGKQLRLVKGLARIVFFHHDKRKAFHDFVGCEPILTGKAFPPAADTRAFFCRS